MKLFLKINQRLYFGEVDAKARILIRRHINDAMIKLSKMIEVMIQLILVAGMKLIKVISVISQQAGYRKNYLG